MTSSPGFKVLHRINRRESRSKGQAVGSAFQLLNAVSSAAVSGCGCASTPALVHTDGLLHIGGRLENGS